MAASGGVVTSQRKAVVTATIPLTLRSFHLRLVDELVARGYDVVVASSPGEDLDRLSARYRAVAIPMKRDISPFSDLIALGRWIRLLARERPELLLTITPKASLLGQIAGWCLRVPRRVYYLGGLRCEVEAGVRRVALALVERVTARRAHTVVVNSPSLARAALDRRIVSATSLRVIRPGSSHGVDSMWFSPRASDNALAGRLGLCPEIPVIGFVGRLTADKGIDTLLAALNRIASTGTRVQLLVVGYVDESDSDRYIARLRELPIRVALVDSVLDVRPYYSLMSVHVLPSRREGFPNVVLEAAAMGLPTVTTDATGAVDSVIDTVTGLLVPRDDAIALADAILRLVSDPRLARRLGRQGRDWVEAEFQPERVIAQFAIHVLGEDPVTERTVDD